MRTFKQILGWEEGRGNLLNLCFSALIVLALFTVAVGLHVEFTAPGDSLHAEKMSPVTGQDSRLP
ncbi:MAG: hypothetical protein EXS64_15150 [Candidatus Latescibacteria bacterium]|nr:hypothetical protein [Candidatus Latescibacterota bacterium]